MFVKAIVCIVTFQLALSGDSHTINNVNVSAMPSNISHVTDTVNLKRMSAIEKPSFKDEEKKIFDFINSILRKILPEVMKGSSTNLSPTCTGAMMKMFGGIRKLRSWTLKLLDSMGKPTSGILHGTPYSAANFDECLSISITGKGDPVTSGQEEFFHGQYCRLRMTMNNAIIEKVIDYKYGRINSSEVGKLREMIDSLTFVPFTKSPLSHFIGLCLPSVCTEEDVTKLLGSISVPATIQLDECHSNEKLEVDVGKRIVLGILFLLFLVIIIGTVIDKLIHLLKPEKLNALLKRRSITVAISFSVCRNTKQLFRKIANDDNCDTFDSKAIRGLGVLSVCFLIIYHTYLPPFEAFYLQASNLSNLEHYLNQTYFAFIVALPIAIETLFLISGYSLTNKIWKSTWKDGKKKVNVISIILGTYVRLCLPFLLCIAIAFLLPLVSSGPFWSDVFGNSEQNCQTYWWRHLVMINNFFDREDQCLPHFWYVSCLMQLTIFSTIMLYIISRNRKLGMVLFLCAILGCHITVGTLTYIKLHPPVFAVYFMDKSTNDFWRISESLPLNHVGTFAIGMAMGTILTRKCPQKFKLVNHIIGWILSMGCVIGICLLLMYFKPESNLTKSPFGVALFAAIHKPLFAAAVSWILYTSSYNYAGFVGHILSWSIFDPLFKMNYFAYLLHLIVISFHVVTTREHFGYSHMDSIMRSLSYICLTFVASYIACMAIDYPVKSLRAAIFPSNFRQVNITYFSNKQNITSNYNGKANDQYFVDDGIGTQTAEPKA